MDNEKKMKELESKVNAITSIPQLKSTSSLKEVIDAINKITSNLKRRS